MGIWKEYNIDKHAKNCDYVSLIMWAYKGDILCNINKQACNYSDVTMQYSERGGGPCPNTDNHAILVALKNIVN